MRIPSLVLAVAFLLLASHAAAQSDVAACVEGHKLVQTARESGRFLQGRDAAARCAQPSCPQLIREDCAAWYIELAESTPTVVFDVRDHVGRDVAEAKLTLDATPLDNHGRAIALDPGAHELRVAAAGYDPQLQHVMLHQGEKNRRIAITLQPVPRRAPLAPASTPKFSPAVITLGVTGVVGLGTFAALAIAGKVENNQLDGYDCKPECARGDVNTVNRLYIAADVAAAIGGSAAIAATVLYVLDRKRERKLDVALHPLGVSVRGAF